MQIKSPPLTGQSGTLAAGVVTLGAALPMPGGGLYRLFGASLATGDQALVSVKDAAGVVSWRMATYDSSADTLTLGAESGATGTLAAAGAVEVWANPATAFFDHGPVGNLAIDFSALDLPEVHLAQLQADGILSVILPLVGVRHARLDVTSTNGTWQWLLDCAVVPATPWGQSLDLQPPAGSGAVRSYWLTAGPGRLDITWQDVYRP